MGGSWLAVGSMLTDVVFETDAAGRFTAFGPGRALGYPTARLIGTEVAALLTPMLGHPPDAMAQFSAIFGTICTECFSWQGKIQLTRADGSAATYRLALAPRIIDGTAVGSYGMLSELDAPGAKNYTPPGGVVTGTPLLDAETGLWTARVFTDELARRFDRLDVEEMPGTLLYLGFSRVTPELQGPAAMRVAEELRDVVRPTDLLGRIDASTIALWCDGMDHLTGAERAARFCGALPAIMPEHSLISAGLATRWPGSGDEPTTVTERASVALRLADLATERLPVGPGASGAWRVWQQD